MRKTVLAAIAGFLLSVPGTATALEISLLPNYGMVLSPDISGSGVTEGGIGYTGRLLLAGSMFAQYEVGFESGLLSVYKKDGNNGDITSRTIPLTALLRYNFYSLGDIKPYFISSGGVYHTVTKNGSRETKNNFGASAGLGTRLASSGMPFFIDTSLRGTFIFDNDFENDMLIMLHVAFGAGLKF